MEDAKIVEESSPQQDVETESSTVELAEPTAEQGAQDKEIPFHEHPRWQEVQQEKKRKEEEARYWQEQYVQLAQNKAPVVEHDPYAGLDPQSRVFFEDIDKRAKRIAEATVSEKERTWQTTITRLAEENAKIREKLFRESNTDVPPGSEEEHKIARLISLGVPEEQAAWAVMGPKRVNEAARKGIVKKEEKTQMKAKANLQSTSIPENTSVPKDKALSFREDLERRLREAGM